MLYEIKNAINFTKSIDTHHITHKIFADVAITVSKIPINNLSSLAQTLA